MTMTSNLRERAYSLAMQDRAPPAGSFTTVAEPAARGQRLDRFLADAIGTLSRSRVKSLIEQGLARRDGTVLSEPAEPVRPGATYVARPAGARAGHAAAAGNPLRRSSTRTPT